MKCPFCGNLETAVLESRGVEEHEAIRRRRQCESCGKRFTTYEKAKESVLWVIKKNGQRELFNKDKLKGGLMRALEKRPVSLALVNEMVDEIEREMLSQEAEEVSSSLIGKSVLRKLKSVDKVAWLRFASVYLEFQNLSDFEKALEKKI